MSSFSFPGRAALLLCLAGFMGWLCSCSSTNSSSSSRAPHVPEVSMPTDLNRNEEELLPDVADALRRAGFDPHGRGDAEYELSFSVEAGPINVDTALRLQRGRREVARSFARVGGARTIFKRRQVIQESFDKALRSFERQLPRFGDGAGRDDGSDDGGYDERYDRRDSDWDTPPRGAGRDSGRDSDRASAEYDADVEYGTPYEDQR